MYCIVLNFYIILSRYWKRVFHSLIILNDMNKDEIDNIKAQMRKGTLEFCVLTLLSRCKAYPSDIIRILSDLNFIVVEGTIYTLLNRLKREGKLQYEWQESTQGPPRKYFFITPYGRQVLKAMNEAWNEIATAVNNLSKTKNYE